MDYFYGWDEWAVNPLYTPEPAYSIGRKQGFRNIHGGLVLEIGRKKVLHRVVESQMDLVPARSKPVCMPGQDL